MIKKSHVPFSGTQVSPLSINPLHRWTTMLSLFWLWSEKFIREREGLGWLLGLQWVKDQLKLEKHPIKIFYFVSLYLCSSHLSSVRLILFHIYFNFVWISFKFHFKLIAISFQSTYNFLFFSFISFYVIFKFILLYFSYLYFTLLWRSIRTWDW